MALMLSTPEIDTTVDMSQFAIPGKTSLAIPKFLEFEVGEPQGAAWGVGAESLRSRLVLSYEPASERQSSLSRLGESRGRVDVPEISIPSLDWPLRQDPALTSSVRNLLKTLWAIAVSRALQAGFPLQKTIVSVFEDPTEQERKVVLRLTCDANAVQALAFWDSLETDLQSWLKTLSETDRMTFITRLGLRVHWR